MKTAIVTSRLQPRTSLSHGKLARFLACLSVAAALLLCPCAWAVTVEQLISREDQELEVVGRQLAIGRDGYVYLARNRMVVRFDRDGKRLAEAKPGWAITNVVANAEGVVAIANAHMTQSVKMLSPEFEQIALVRDFTGNDHTNWGAPGDVQTGPSGDFYAADQHRDLIKRFSSRGKMGPVYSIKETGESFTGRVIRFRVVEKLERFYIATEAGNIHAIGFDGKKIWSIKAPVGGPPHVSAGDMDADDDGNIYLLANNQDTIEVLDKDGKPSGKIKLEMGDRVPTGDVKVRVSAKDILVKRSHKTEMFQAYDRATGKFRYAIHADVEYSRMEYPSEVWQAGQAIAFTVTLETPGKKVTPPWPVRMARLNEYEWIDLPVVDGKVTPPADAAGLYALRVGYGEYMMESVVEVRSPGSQGTVNILTPANRVYYGRGEEIPVSVLVRAKEVKTTGLSVQLQDRATGDVVFVVKDKEIKWDAARGSATIPAGLTAKLGVGNYVLTTTPVPGLTVVPQPLVIGPGLRQRPVFNIIQGGDGAGPLLAGRTFDAPLELSRQIQRLQRVRLNMIMDRIGGDVNVMQPPLELNAVIERLKKDPLGVAPEKAQLENTNRQAIAARGAFGVEEQGILFHMDTLIPALKPGEPNPGGMVGSFHMADAERIIKAITAELKPYPAVRGWSWACNWWIAHDRVFLHANADRKAWYAARRKALETGKWDDSLDRTSDLWVKVHGDTDKQLTAALHAVAPNMINAVSGPYRQPGVHPPFAFEHAKEVDLFFQSEQIQAPFTTHHNLDFYKRPGKRAFGHIETPLDIGTGDFLLPNVLQQVARGADGSGWEGNIPGRSGFDRDPRSTMQGVVSVLRSLTELLQQYGPWLTTMRNNDQVAIVVSTRMMRLEDWAGHLGGHYFARLYEAYNACMYAHRPAGFVFTEDVTPEALKKFKAVLVVGQRVELDGPLAKALDEAQAAGVAVFHDGNCREEVVKTGLVGKPLGITFDRVEKDPCLTNDDSAYYRLPQYFKEHAKVLGQVLAAVKPVAGLDNPAILLNERRSGEGRFIWAINNDMGDWEPGRMWRLSLISANRAGQLLPIDLGDKNAVVYDVFAQRRLDKPQLDLRQMPARLLAVLPKPIESLALAAPERLGAGEELSWKVTIAGPQMTYPLCVRLLDADGGLIEASYPVKAEGSFTVPMTAQAGMTLEAVELISGKRASKQVQIVNARVAKRPAAPKAAQLVPVERLFGPHLSSLAISGDGASLAVSAANWDDNVYVLSAADGAVRNQGSVGHHFAYGAQAGGERLFVQGYDLATAEGYHLYELGGDGKPLRRFAIFGVPQRGVKWNSASELVDRINAFVVAPGGQWVAAGGSMGIIVWDKDGKKLWADDWIKSTRRSMTIFAQGDKTLIMADQRTVQSYNALTGQKGWQAIMPDVGVLQGGAASADGRTVAVYTDSDGFFNLGDTGHLYVLRDGKVIHRLFLLAQNVVLTPDGRYMGINAGREFIWYAIAQEGGAEGGIAWTFKPDDALHGVRLSPDGKKLVMTTDLGTLYVLDTAGKVLLQRDCSAFATAQWASDSELIVATWRGDVMRLGMDNTVKWQVRLEAKGPGRLAQAPAPEKLPTLRANWVTAQAKPLPLTPNLLSQVKSTFMVGFAGNPAASALRLPSALITDGDTKAPGGYWSDWTTVALADAPWTGKVVLQVDSPQELRVTGVTFAEDPARPDTWVRDVLIQVFDAKRGIWVDGPWLTADTATHSHTLDKALIGSKFRFIADKSPENPGASGIGWPVGNLRLAELVFHGEVLEGSDKAALPAAQAPEAAK